MSYSIQKVNGTTVENRNGEIYVNGRHIDSGRLTIQALAKSLLILAAVFLMGYFLGR